MKRGQRGSGCCFMIAPVIIEASKGKSAPAWLETSIAAAVGGDVLDPGRLDPPPAVVEELEERVGGLGELLVEAPLVLVVLAAHAAAPSARPSRAATWAARRRRPRRPPAGRARRRRRRGRRAGSATAMPRRTAAGGGSPLIAASPPAARGSRRARAPAPGAVPLLGPGEVADRAGRVEARAR